MNKEDIIKVGKRLYKKDLTTATSGNISIKTDDGIWITTSGSALGDLSVDELVLIDADGNEKLAGKASSEKMLHTEVYKIRPDVKAIIHTHSAYSTTFAVCHEALNLPIMSENVLYFDEIPVAEYAMPSSMKLVENTVKHLSNNDVVLMANHGVIVIADNLRNAFYKLETAEYYAKIMINSKILGNPKLLSDEDVKELVNLRKH